MDRLLKAVKYWGCTYLYIWSLLKKFRATDLKLLWLIKIMFHKVSALHLLGEKDWESFTETILNAIMHH